MFELRSALRLRRLAEETRSGRRLDAMEDEHPYYRRRDRLAAGEFSELDERFHRLIHGASHNRFIIDFYDVIAMVFHYHYQWNKAQERERNDVAVAEHLAYIAALKSRDLGKVDAACRKHLKSARNTLLTSIPEAGSRNVPDARRA